MRETKEVLGGQLDLFASFDRYETKRDEFLNQLIRGAENMRWLTYRLKYTELTDRVKKFWNAELDELLDLQAELCSTIAVQSSQYHNWTEKQFSMLWKKSDYLNMTECPSLEDVMSHHKNCNRRLESAIMSQNPFLSNSGPVIDNIMSQLKYHNNLFTSYYLNELQRIRTRS